MMPLSDGKGITDEREAAAMVRDAKRIFLLEPDYKRKYPPLGLLKIASMARANGSKVKYGRNYMGEKCDLICCTSLFTYDSPVVIKALRQALALSGGTPVMVGGVYASIMPNHIRDRIDDKRLHVMPGFSKAFDLNIPDYTLNWEINKLKENDVDFSQYSFVFTSRGCPNDCSYCVVPGIEPTLWINPTWREHMLDQHSGVVLCDNNLTAGTHMYNVLEHVARKKKDVIIDSGIDCKYVTDEMAERFGKVRFSHSGLRMAFDRIEEDGMFQESVLKILNAGASPSGLMAYVLFNFNESPQEADYRARVCKKFLNIRPYPQRYQKLNQTGRSTKPYVGKLWTRRLSKMFRAFWLHRGLGKRAFFDDYVRSRPPSQITQEDLDCWNYESDKWQNRSLDGQDATKYLPLHGSELVARGELAKRRVTKQDAVSV